MRNLDGASRALAKADNAQDEITRTVWLAKASDYAVSARAVLVGGSAVNLHTGSYQPTDIDLCAYLDESDRAVMRDLGFAHTFGDHFSYTFSDGEEWLVEFPDSWVDGEVSRIELNAEESLDVISVESLVVDRISQATDQTLVTFEEAVRLCFAVSERAEWAVVEQQIAVKDAEAPGIALRATYERVMAEVWRIEHR